MLHRKKKKAKRATIRKAKVPGFVLLAGFLACGHPELQGKTEKCRNRVHCAPGRFSFKKENGEEMNPG
jgi:hypothetical protein